MILLSIIGAIALSTIIFLFVNDLMTKKIKRDVENECKFYEYKYYQEKEELKHSNSMELLTSFEKNNGFPKKMPDEWKKEFKEFIKKQKNSKKKIKIFSKDDKDLTL